MFCNIFEGKPAANLLTGFVECQNMLTNLSALPLEGKAGFAEFGADGRLYFVKLYLAACYLWEATDNVLVDAQGGMLEQLRRVGEFLLDYGDNLGVVDGEVQAVGSHGVLAYEAQLCRHLEGVAHDFLLHLGAVIGIDAQTVDYNRTYGIFEFSHCKLYAGWWRTLIILCWTTLTGVSGGAAGFCDAFCLPFRRRAVWDARRP